MNPAGPTVFLSDHAAVSIGRVDLAMITGNTAIVAWVQQDTEGDYYRVFQRLFKLK